MTMSMSKTDSNTPNNTRKAKQAIKTLFARPDFRLEVSKFQRKWGVEKDNPNREKNMQKLEFLRVVLPVVKAGRRGMVMNNYPAFARYDEDLRELGAKFGLDYEHWSLVLWEYVRTGSESELLNHDSLQVDTAPKIQWNFKKIADKRRKRIILIELGDNTTLKDVKAAWHQVEDMRRRFKMVKPKFKEWKNFERDKRAYELSAQRKTIAEIGGILRNEYGADLDYGNIKKIVSTFRKKFGLPKGGKLITSKTKTNNRVSKIRLR